MYGILHTHKSHAWLWLAPADWQLAASLNHTHTLRSTAMPDKSMQEYLTLYRAEEAAQYGSDLLTDGLACQYPVSQPSHTYTQAVHTHTCLLQELHSVLMSSI